MDELEALAGQVRRSLHWAAFLVGMMALILIIDLQLKKSIAKQAVEVAKWLGEVRYGQPAGPPDTPAADAGGDHGVGGDAGMAAPDADRPGTVERAPDSSVDGAPVRAPGDGRRTRRAPGRG